MFSKKNINYFALGGLAIICIALACIFPGGSLCEFFDLPYRGLAELVKVSVVDKYSTFNAIISWILFGILGFLPCVYPLVQLIRKKNNKIIYACWLVVLVLSYVTLYVHINPQSLKFVIDYNNSGLAYVTKIGLSLTVYLTVILLLLIELWLKISKENFKALHFSKVLLFILAVALIINTFYVEFSDMIKAFNKISAFEEYLGINYFYTVLNYFFNAVPYIAVLFVLFKLDKFLDGLKENMFDRHNELLAHKLYKALALSIALKLGLAIANNLITFLLERYLYNISYSANVDLIVFLVTTLGALFIMFMTKSIEIKEDNDLTI